MSLFTPYRHSLSDSEHFRFIRVIRVVRVAAGRWHDPIRCELIQRKLEEASEKHPYRALSYVWGSSSVTDTITLEGFSFQITLNLSCALRHLRKVDEDIFLWVDALVSLYVTWLQVRARLKSYLLTLAQCINQQDHQERSHQVSIMQSIYKNAEDVIVFMGDGRGHRVNRSQLIEPPVSPTITLHGYERDKSFLTSILRTCHASGLRKLTSTLTAAACAMGLISLFSDQDAVEQACLELVELGEEIRYYLFECLRAFVICPWWSRIWVVQEIAVGTAVTIQWGTFTLSWETLVATANVWSLPKTRQVASSSGIEPENLKVFVLFANQLTGLQETRRRWREGGTDLVRLLQEFSDRQASDDRDKVYGLLSLAKQDQRYIQPDYELDVFETYRATALALIGKGGSLACWAGDQKRKFNRGLPSWIPDWSIAVDNGDKRRMDLFDHYDANRGWTLRIIEDEKEYWTTVESQMELLVNSPAIQAGRLQRSLRRYVLEYIELLIQRARSMQPDNVHPDDFHRFRLDLHNLTLDQRQVVNSHSTLVRPRCYKEDGSFLRPDLGSIQRWMSEVRTRVDQAFDIVSVELKGASQTEKDSSMYKEIHQHLANLGTALEEGNPDIACYESWKIEELISRAEISFIMEKLICQCHRLSSLCSEFPLYNHFPVLAVWQLPSWRPWALHDAIANSKTEATDNWIYPSKLFGSSYTLRGTASWLTEYQSEKANPQRLGTRLLPYEMEETPDRVLAMQMVVVDSVTNCGPRQFGWADTKSALTTLVSWLYLSGPVIASDATGERGEVQLNHARIRQFAKTIVGGMCRRGGSYQKADDSPLGPLEDWLRQCLMVAKGTCGWEFSHSDTSGGPFVTLEDWIRMPVTSRFGSRWGSNDHRGDPVVPRQEWLRRSLESRGFAAPPSPFLEDIQVATDGRVFFLTGNGSMGLGPASMRKGDTIHILPSGRAHFVLRSKPMESVPADVNQPDWMKALKSDRYEVIGDCYLYTDSALDGRIPVKEEPVVEGSLPFELLGERYFKNQRLPIRQTALFV